MAVQILKVPQDKRLPDTEQWVNRFEFVSSNSGSTYIISQHRQKRHWACSCRAWTTRRKCSHLKACGLPIEEKPREVILSSAEESSTTSSAKPQAKATSKATSQPASTSAAPVVIKTKRAISFENI